MANDARGAGMRIDESILGNRISDIVRSSTTKIVEINRRYARPRIRMGKGVKFALLMLRLYLIVLVVLLGYKFWTIIHGAG